MAPTGERMTDTEPVDYTRPPLSTELRPRRPATATYPAGASLLPRIIPDHEFVWILAGEAVFQSSSTEEVALARGDLLLVGPGVRHGFTWDPIGETRHGYVHFSVPQRPASEPLVRRMTARDPLQGLCDYLLWLGSLGEGAADGALATTTRYLFDLVRAGPLPHGAPLTAPALERAVRHAAAAWAAGPLRRLTGEELAGAAAVSVSYLNRVFRSELGLSAVAALERARIARAEQLLANTSMSIDAVAQHCGYADRYHFSRRFRALTGLPPARYRRAGARAPSVTDDAGTRRLVAALWDGPRS